MANVESGHYHFHYLMALLEELESLLERRWALGQRALVGIDGFGGSGKSVLADRIAHHLPNSSVIHVDDFYKPSAQRTDSPISSVVVDPHYDWDRLAQTVFTYGAKPVGFTYQRYDWARDRLAEFMSIPESCQVLLIEGVYALQHRFLNEYTIKIWVETPDELILQRAVARDGINQLTQWTQEWMPRERRYQQVEQPDQQADLVVRGY